MTLLGELSSAGARGLIGEQVVALLPVGPLEAHGAHLPLATDVIISEAVASRAAARLADRGVTALVLPSVTYAVASLAANMPGTLSVRGATVTAMLTDVAFSLGTQGFGALALVSTHLEPGHLAALREAVDVIQLGAHIRVTYPEPHKHADRLMPEFQRGAFHAGRFETSMIMALRPDLVDEAVRTALPDNPRSLYAAVDEGARTLEDAGAPDGYFGDPAAATAAEGEESLDALASIVDEAVAALLAQPAVSGS